MIGNFTYDNFVQGQFKVNENWVEGIFHGEWFISLDGQAYKLDNIDDDTTIKEHTWKKLVYLDEVENGK